MTHLVTLIPTPATPLFRAAVLGGLAATLLIPGPLRSQSHDHAGMEAAAPAASLVATAADALAGQAAFETIAAVVRRLEADPSTDWSRVDIEALRRHLVDMDRVMMEAGVEATPLPGGARFAGYGHRTRCRLDPANGHSARAGALGQPPVPRCRHRHGSRGGPRGDGRWEI
jgi:hypothetical protein